MAKIIVDTGPLVAYFDRSSQNHGWIAEEFKTLTDPLLTCEAVVTEVLFLLRRDGLNPDWILHLIERGELLCGFDLETEIASIRKLLRQYRTFPATLADVCLLRMSELHSDSVVLTLDRDFLIYRRNGRQKIPLLAPFVP
jgi:predicted nucleic acid-binding protein